MDEQQQSLFSIEPYQAAVEPVQGELVVGGGEAAAGGLSAQLFGGAVQINVVARRPLTELERLSLWLRAFDGWLELVAPASKRAYRSAWDLLLAYTGKKFWQIDQADISAWLRKMDEAGLSDGTISLRLAGISSFYRYCCEEFTSEQLRNSDGTHGRLIDFNPAAGRRLRKPYKPNPYDRSHWLDENQLRAFLHAIPQDSVQGLRDYALFATYIHTARRNSEVRKLRWGDIDAKGESVYYVWSGKGKKNQKAEMPMPAWQAICVYLKAAGRLGEMAADSYIFTALADGPKRLKTLEGRAVVAENWEPGTLPLSEHQVNDLMKKYCRRAGIDPAYAHVHTLRHSSAMLRVRTGQGIQQVQKLLGHSSAGTTEIYVRHALQKPEDAGWRAADALLAVEPVHSEVGPSGKRKGKK